MTPNPATQLDCVDAVEETPPVPRGCWGFATIMHTWLCLVQHLISSTRILVLIMLRWIHIHRTAQGAIQHPQGFWGILVHPRLRSRQPSVVVPDEEPLLSCSSGCSEQIKSTLTFMQKLKLIKVKDGRGSDIKNTATAQVHDSSWACLLCRVLHKPRTGMC
ncbi:hypothetical protein V5799_015107 [Amblyomma americanum]|uniref:Uncharacterized protein n=1 Tax=Amblyomma americanum TaxID=6943 RepID=A0AAQ4E138_AMBAM